MKRGRWAAPLVSLFLILTCVFQLAPIPILANSSPAWGEYLVRTFTDSSGNLIDEAIFPSKPPDITMATAQLPDMLVQGSANTLTGVPTFRWSYGCSATSGAMLAGYYDLIGYSNLYVGPTNGGACPLTNAVWGSTAYPDVTCYECPLSASHLGIDSRTAKGSVDDYWIDYLNVGPDPYVAGGWAEHTSDCLGDFMGTNQSKYWSVNGPTQDGSTTFYFNSAGAPLYDYTGSEPTSRDGCHGLRLFFESRGYTVDTNYSQYIDTYKTGGFTFLQFQQEIDAGFPVLIQVSGHTMLGIGYDTASSTIYVHDTWDYSTHAMTWGGLYSGMQHYGVTVIHPQDAPAAAMFVISPYGGENWTIGSSQNITWASTGLTGNVNIQISRNGGSTWTDIITGTANDGTESWMVTGPATTQARIKIVSVVNPGILDSSNANFSIADISSITVTSPNGGESWAIGSSQNITWTSTSVTGNVNIQISRDGGTNWADIITGTANDGTQSWTVTGAATTQARIKITSVVNASIFDSSNANFTISSTPVSSITVISPNGGENWVSGSSHAITWSSANLTGNVNIQLSRDGGTVWETLFSNIANDGTENWPVSLPATTQAMVKVVSVNNGAVYDASNAVFIITAAPTRIIGLSGSMAFGNVTVGSSLSKTLTITNTGNSALTVSSITCPAGFSGNWSGSIGVGSSRDVTITFRPTSAAPYSGSITVNSDKTAGTGTIACSGTGVPPPPLTLISPNGGQTFDAGTTQNITWASNGLTGNIKIELLQGGVSVKTISSYRSVSSGSYSWSISSTQSDGNYRIRLTSTSVSGVSDESNSDFHINGPPPPVVRVLYPNGGETLPAGSKCSINWTSSNLTGYLKVELLKSGVAVKTLTSSARVSAGTYSWSIPSTQTPGSGHTIRLTSTTNAAVTDASNSSFTIIPPPPPSINLISPNGGETFSAGSKQTVRWTAVSLSGYVKIELFQGGVAVKTLSARSSISSGSYIWSIASTQYGGSGYSIKLTSTSSTTVFDQSGSFNINGPPPPTVTVTSPNGGETWARGSVHAVTWSSVNLSGYVKIELMQGTTVVRTISSRAYASSGSYNWTVASTQAPGSYRIRITSTTSATVTDMSNSTFVVS